MIIKKTLRILWLTFVTMAAVLFAGALILQLPQVQTSIADKVMGSLSERLDGDISIEKIHFKPFTTLVLKNAVIIDKHPAKDPCDSTLTQIDTFFTAEYIIAKFSLNGLLDRESIKIKSAYVGNAMMNLVLEDRYEEDGERDAYNNLSRIFRIMPPKAKKEPSPKEIFRLGIVEISDMKFALFNRSVAKTPYHGGINWNDLQISSIDLTAKGLRFKDGIMYGRAEKLSFREKSGFVCHQMSGDTRVGRGRTIIEDLRINDIWSDLDIPLFMMSYSGVKDFNNFIEKVRLDAEIATSVLDFRTIIPFAPQLEGNRLKATVSGRMSGCVDDFTVTDIRIVSHAGGFKGTVNGRIKGIPDIDRMWIDGKVSNMSLTAEGLGRFVSEWMPGGSLDFGRFGIGTIFHAQADAKGYLNNLDVSADLKSADGGIMATARLDEIMNRSKPVVIRGRINTSDLNIGKLIGSDVIGPASLSAGLEIIADDMFSVGLDSLTVNKLNLNGYDYSDIQARGRYDSRSLSGTVISKDPNLNFIFQGGYAKSDRSKNTVYKFNASVGHADLNAINVDRRGKSVVQMRTNGNFTRTGNGDIFGRIDIGDILLENKSGRYNIGDIVVTSYSTSDNTFQARFEADFAEALYTGSASVIDFINDLEGMTLKRETPALSGNQEYVWKGNTYSLDVICHDVHNVLAFALPGMYIENGTSFRADMNADGNLKAELLSNRLAFKKNYLKGLKISMDNADSSISGEMTCDEISMSSIKMNDNLLQVHADDNHFGAGFSFDNHSDPETRGELIINGDISREEDTPVFDISIRPSSIHYNSKQWNIQSSGLRIHGGDIEIDSFGLVSDEQTAGIFGKISQDSEEMMTLKLERFDLSIINALLPADFGVKGIVTGTAELKSPTDDMELTVDMVCDSSSVANLPLGTVIAGTTWDDQNRHFNIFVRNELDGNRNIDIDGTYSPDSRMIAADIALDRLNAGYAQPFLAEIFSEMRGYISGRFQLDGTPERLSLINNDGNISDALLKIGYTGVIYKADGPFHMDAGGVHFDNITIRDRFDGKGTVSGSINYDHFRDITFDTGIKVDRIEAVNLSENDGDVFYGNLFGSGNISITGPLNAIVMDINAVTEKAGQLHIPVSSSLTSTKVTNLLKFKELDKVDFIDPYEIFVLRTNSQEVSDSDFFLKLKVNARPDVEAFVEIDKASGNVLTGRGSGNISLDVSEDVFNINGDYTINSGNYKFVAMGLVGRDFTIQDGSSIRFNGDIMESTLDIDATYRTKASISTLISDTTSVANRRTVDCGISIKDKLSNPQLSFSIEIPDLDPTIKSRVESALSTEDKVQKQFLSLIISNNFLPDEQSGIVNNSSVLYTNVTEMMANQINNIFQKLDIPLDLGLNYQPNERGNDIFDVAVSTQLFNNRVVVNGNIGNRQYSSGNTQNEVVGDIDIEIKLDRSGSFRLNLFSHSADQYTNYLDNSQRNGVGITYQTEFNTFRQFFRTIFSSKKKRIERRMAEEKAAIGEKRITLDIRQ